MSTIYLDDEVVDFDGPHPKDLIAILKLLSSYLKGSGRRMISFEVDGRDYLKGGRGDVKSFERIEVRSIMISDYIPKRWESIAQGMGGLLSDLEELSIRVLGQGWEKTIVEAQGGLESTVPIVEALQNLGKLGEEVGGLLEEYQGIVVRIGSVVSLRDAAGLSDLVHVELISFIKEAVFLIEKYLLVKGRGLKDESITG